MHLSVFTKVHESLKYSQIENLENFVDDTKVIYVTNVSEILPLDMDFNNPPSNFVQRLRPEYFNDYYIPLSTNGCINLTQEAVEEDDFEICEASLKLKTEKINEIVELLDSLTIMPIDSKSMTQALHANGINCRYLGLIANRTALPHIKDLCMVEIIARTCKRLLFQHLADLTMENNQDPQESSQRISLQSDVKKSIKHIEGNYFVDQSEDYENLLMSEMNIQNPEYRKNAFLARYEKQLKWPNYKELKNKNSDSVSLHQNIGMEGSLKECIVDYINLVFGIGEESDYF